MLFSRIFLSIAGRRLRGDAYQMGWLSAGAMRETTAELISSFIVSVPGGKY